MAKITTNSDFDIDVSSAQFVRKSAGTSGVADVFAPQAVAAVAEATKDIFVQFKEGEAETKSKSLLEEFTGETRFLDIANRENEILNQEEEVATSFAGLQPDDPAYKETREQFSGIQDMKAKLELEREAVVQGLLTNDEYRKRAETSFYQMVAMTPGIKEELAKVMGEHLGIDPRGQTAKMTLKARDDLNAKTDSAQTKIIGELTKRGFWDDDLTDQANITKYWPHVRKGLQAQTELKVMTDHLNGQTAIEDSEMAAAAGQARNWVAESEQVSLYAMGEFNGQNVWDLSAEEILAMDPEVKLKWIQHVQGSASQFSGVLNSLSSSTNGKFDPTRNLATVKDQSELLVSILQSDKMDDVLTSQLNIGKARNALLIEAAKAGIAMSQPEAVKLAAYGDYFNITNMIGVNIRGATMVLQGLNGDVPNIANLTDEDKTATLGMYQESLKGTAKAFETNPDKYNDSDINNMGNVALMVAKQDPGEVDVPTKMQLNRLVGAKGFMDRLESVNPKQAQLLRQGVIQHQQGLGKTYNKEIVTTVEKHAGDRLDALDFHLEKVEDRWMVMPNSFTTDEQISGIKQLGGRFPSPPAKLARRQKEEADIIKSDITVSLNRTRGFIQNYVTSKAAVLGISEAAAAKQVARDMGIAADDIEPKLPGFAEEYGVKKPKVKPAYRGLNKSDKDELNEQSDEAGKVNATDTRAAPGKKLDDGTYEINGALYQIKNGEIISID